MGGVVLGSALDLADDPRVPWRRRLSYAREGARTRRREKSVNYAYVSMIVSKTIMLT